MTSPMKPWESSLNNSSQVLRSSSTPANNLSQISGRNGPVLPPRPSNSPAISSTYNSYNMPYSSYGSSLGAYGSYGSYGSYGMPYRSSLYNSYSSYGSGYGGSYGGMYGMGGGYPNVPNYTQDDAERRFIQYAEESSRNTFANVEGIVRAFNSIAMMLDNTFFAMTSSFRAVLSVAENFGRLRTMFGHIWYSINIFRLVTWLYRKVMHLLGFKVQKSATSLAWKQAASGALPDGRAPAPSGSSWPTFAFLGMLVSAPYIISKFLPKYEDKSDPANWKSPGVKAKAAFDFVASAPNELTIQTNDEITLAPTYVQEEMNLRNSGWAFALSNGRSGVVPLNYLVLSKQNYPVPNNNNNNNVPVPRIFNNSNSNGVKSGHTKRVSFGENQVFENVDLEDYVSGKKTHVIRDKADETKVGTSEVTENDKATSKTENDESNSQSQ